MRTYKEERPKAELHLPSQSINSTRMHHLYSSAFLPQLNIYPMKRLLIILLILASTSCAFSATTETAPVSQPVNVTVKSEGQELATGFAAAFTRLRHVPFHVQLQHEGGAPIVINDIKMVSAAGAALLIETNKGLFYVINPKDVIWISDAPVEKPVAATAK